MTQDTSLSDEARSVAVDAELFPHDDPYQLVGHWLKDAEAKEINDPNGVALATVDEDGLPDLRMVLMKGYDSDGFVFYTNAGSAKGRQLLGQKKAALLFHWKSLRRQVRARGPVEVVSDAEADAYFASRPRQSQIGAWASDQSQPLEGRFALERKVAEYALKFGVGSVPRPPHWLGFRLRPVQMEFWRDGAFRLHDRMQFKKAAGSDLWTRARLYP
jgi:pyridoxamine 5'-phosphate oxidase